MLITPVIDAVERFIFRHRTCVIAVFLIATVGLLWSATGLRMDAAFTKNIPLNHSYMQTYMDHQKDFGGANSVMVTVTANDGDMFTEAFFEKLKSVHDQLFFIPGVDRPSVQSLYSPSTRFTEVVEDGFAGGPVIPADFKPDATGLGIVQSNISKAGIVGRLVSNDYSSAMVRANLQEFNPETGDKLDTLALAKLLEDSIRGEFETNDISIQIIGFSKMIGDVADGARSVLLFFTIALVITALMVYFFSHSILLTLLPLSCSIMAVVWQLGALPLLGFGIDPMSVLVPFLVFAIGVSHGVQMINAMAKSVGLGLTSKEAAQNSFRNLLLPGGIALLSDTIGFMTILSIDIGIVRELAITASIGVAVIILTNLVLLPVLLSYVKFSPAAVAKLSQPSPIANRLWDKLALCATRPVSYGILAVAVLLFIGGYWQASQMRIGSFQPGAPALHADARYNQDTFLITDRYSITTDVMSIIVEAEPQSCANHEVMNTIDQFQWRLEQVDGVQSSISLPTVAKLYNAGFNEGNPKWRVLPRNEAALVQSIAQVPTNTGLLNSNCSVMPVYLFLEDHTAETIQAVIAAVKEAQTMYQTESLKFRLASGPVGVMAAKNEAVADAQVPMMLYVYGAVIVLCLLSFRSVKATAAVVLPLYLVSVLAQGLMTQLGIGLTVSTLPVIALGVGIGVDYGIYILSTMSERIRKGEPIAEAYRYALSERGSAVLFTGVTLAVGVSTWFFSPLKYQVSMGVLLTFMFLVNMLAAVIILPALASIFWRKKGHS
ncbi:efflux RND transporter permease subunit [Echinimonas agarilytica]|uniref:MMPL family transporter n=1 Tax=Echinimonas agarilytica TaxID=1215918 RepID=A0AA42B8L0_9GAMM|nr:MMPL family transporter [Echinimonas agarilytica]MCM2681160.1 MMPL family transporter [Echinimonas agarilytica]